MLSSHARRLSGVHLRRRPFCATDRKCPQRAASVQRDMNCGLGIRVACRRGRWRVLPCSRHRLAIFCPEFESMSVAPHIYFHVARFAHDDVAGVFLEETL